METRISCDLAVVGGGPAGCMAAIAAKRAAPHLDVAIVERAEKTEHRIGEALLTGTILAMAELGIADRIAAAGFHKKIGAAYVWGETSEPWYVNYPPSAAAYPDSFVEPNGERRAIHVTRHLFDEILRDEASKAGVRFVFGRVAGVRSVKAEGTKSKAILSLVLESGAHLVAQRYIDATGQASVLGRALTKRRPVGSPRVARYAYFDNVDWDKARAAGFDPHRTNIVSSKDGWAWIIHLGAHGSELTSIGLVSSPERMKDVRFEDAADVVPRLADFGFPEGLTSPKDAYGVPTEEWHKHPDYSYFCDELHGPNWALCGDAALFLDPILSQGVTLAMHYGMLRGQAAAAQIDGVASEDAQARIDAHYRSEAEILKIVVGEWYGNNRHVGDWKLRSVMVGEESYGRTLPPDEAFRWVTNLENLRGEYDPYPEDQRAVVRARLGLG